MSWRVLYIEESDSISLYLDNIKVKRGANELMFPLIDIAVIVVDNKRLNITVGLINACALRNIPLITCGDNHHPHTIILPLHGHFESSKVLYNQLNWSEKQKSHIWQMIVKNKIKSQYYVAKLVNPNNENINLIERYISEVQPNDETNREGLAAKVYFRCLFGSTFSRHNEDTINACLDYGYSIIRALISRTLVAKGLNTQLGIFHKGSQNMFNLSDDVIELFRPMVDLYVFNNFLNEKIFLREHRMKLLEMLNYKIKIIDQKVTVNHAIEKVVDAIIRFFKEGVVDNTLEINPELYDL